jgi:hypothetical protein
MADIWEAYQFLNKSMKLGLSRADLWRAEAEFKRDFMRRRGFEAEERVAEEVNEWEFFAYLAPAKRKARRSR